MSQDANDKVVDLDSYLENPDAHAPTIQPMPITKSQQSIPQAANQAAQTAPIPPASGNSSSPVIGKRPIQNKTGNSTSTGNSARTPRRHSQNTTVQPLNSTSSGNVPHPFTLPQYAPSPQPLGPVAPPSINPPIGAIPTPTTTPPVFVTQAAPPTTPFTGVINPATPGQTGSALGRPIVRPRPVSRRRKFPWWIIVLLALLAVIAIVISQFIVKNTTVTATQTPTAPAGVPTREATATAVATTSSVTTAASTNQATSASGTTASATTASASTTASAVTTQAICNLTAKKGDNVAMKAMGRILVSGKVTEINSSYFQITVIDSGKDVVLSYGLDQSLGKYTWKAGRPDQQLPATLLLASSFRPVVVLTGGVIQLVSCTEITQDVILTSN